MSTATLIRSADDFDDWESELAEPQRAFRPTRGRRAPRRPRGHRAADGHRPAPQPRAAGGLMPNFTFAYHFLDREWHRSEFASGLSAERFGEELFKLVPKRSTDEIRVWEGRDTERAPDAVVTA